VTYLLDRRDISGTQVAVWRPVDIPVTATVVLLGRPAGDWQTLHLWPLGLVARGYRVVAFDVPNWGNATDLARIDTVLAAQPTTETDRVVLVAVGGVSVMVYGVCVGSPVPGEVTLTKFAFMRRPGATRGT